MPLTQTYHHAKENVFARAKIGNLHAEKTRLDIRVQKTKQLVTKVKLGHTKSFTYMETSAMGLLSWRLDFLRFLLP